jgi:hypothetical protein
MPKPFLNTIAALTLVLTWPSHAVWFEASGQAVVENGNKQVARQRATQEAIKQTLLFSGAKVSSVQQMANGLLKDDRFEVRSSGEVSSIELIDELYHDGYVTVRVRADIFAQNSTCLSSDYQKSIVTTWYPVRNKQQATVGGLYELGRPVAEKLQHEFSQYARNAKIRQLEPYYFSADNKEQATLLAQKAGSQFVLLAQITDMGMQQKESSGLKFWQDNYPTRHFTLNVNLINGITGAVVLDENFSTHAAWDFDLYENVDVNSQSFWQSAYAANISSLLQGIAQKIDDSVSCLPAYGRILQVDNDQLRVNFGSSQGVKQGDTLTLFQMSQFYDNQGQIHSQYQIHPFKVIVRQVFTDSAVLTAVDNAPLANIQANDFVARR